MTFLKVIDAISQRVLMDSYVCILKLTPKCIECVKNSNSEEDLNAKLKEIFPDNLNAHVWNRKVVQMGMSDMALEKLGRNKD